MKTLLVSVSFALALCACSSDTSNSLVTSSLGSVPQGGECTQTSDCDQAGLTCAFPIVSDAGTCVKNPVAYCVAMGQCDIELVCPCGSGTAAQVCVTSDYSMVPIDPNAMCSAPGDASTGDAATGG
jgi:hypothetical protein